MLKYIQLALVMLVLAGCGDSNDDDDDSGGLFSFDAQVREEFLPLDQYQYDDFDLTEDVLYWETRLGPALNAGFPVVFRHELLFFYAQERLAGSFEDRLDELAQIEPLSGFADKCFPSLCLVYIAGIDFADFFTITTQQELAAFFGEIDTEAELAYWLWSEDFIPLDYLVEDGGFEATVETSVLCEQRTRLRVFVDRNGVVTPVERLDAEAVETCEDGIDRQEEVLFQDDGGFFGENELPLQNDGLIIQDGTTSFQNDDGLIIEDGEVALQDGLAAPSDIFQELGDDPGILEGNPGTAADDSLIEPAEVLPGGTVAEDEDVLFQERDTLPVPGVGE